MTIMTNVSPSILHAFKVLENLTFIASFSYVYFEAFEENKSFDNS